MSVNEVARLHTARQSEARQSEARPGKARPAGVVVVVVVVGGGGTIRKLASTGDARLSCRTANRAYTHCTL